LKYFLASFLDADEIGPTPTAGKSNQSLIRDNFLLKNDKSMD
jgi:hypothetical protein